QGEWIAENRSAFAISDPDPVVDGHTLVVPRRMIESWWEAYPEEQADLLALIGTVRELLDQQHAPAGYTIGIDDGEAAGRRGEHLHIHVIPRHLPASDAPRRGIRDLLLVQPTTTSTVESELVKAVDAFERT